MFDPKRLRISFYINQYQSQSFFCVHIESNPSLIQTHHFHFPILPQKSTFWLFKVLLHLPIFITPHESTRNPIYVPNTFIKFHKRSKTVSWSSAMVVPPFLHSCFLFQRSCTTAYAPKHDVPPYFHIFLRQPSSTLMLPLFPSFSPLVTLPTTIMVSNGDASHPKNIPPDKAYDTGRALVELQEQVRKLTHEVGQVKNSVQQNP